MLLRDNFIERGIPIEPHDDDNDELRPLPTGTPNVDREALRSLLREIRLAGHHPRFPGDDRLPVSTDLVAADILCGRNTSQMESHRGNRWFRCLVRMHKTEYRRSPSRLRKKIIVEQLQSQVTSIGGRFVKKKVLQQDGTLRSPMGRRLDPGEMVVYQAVSKRVVEEKIQRALCRRDD